MVKWVVVLLLILFFSAGSYLLFSNPQIKTYRQLVRNYVQNIHLFNEEKEISISFTGDNILARSVNFMSFKNRDFAWSYRNIHTELSNSDLTVINLESPLLKNCPLTNEGFIFCGDYKNISGLSLSGVDVVGMANNHAGDYGNQGILETITYLDSVEILVSGVLERQIAYKNVAGTKFAFLAFNSIGNEPGVLPAKEELMKNLLDEARKNSDFTIVQIHWGNEYTKELTDFQKNTGRFLIENGADLVIGNHPHWIQDYEIYNGKYILYALGNFVFDQEWSKETKEGVIAKFIIKNNKVKSLNFVPIEIRNYGQVFKMNNFDIIPREIK